MFGRYDTRTDDRRKLLCVLLRYARIRSMLCDNKPAQAQRSATLRLYYAAFLKCVMDARRLPTQANIFFSIPFFNHRACITPVTTLIQYRSQSPVCDMGSATELNLCA